MGAMTWWDVYDLAGGVVVIAAASFLVGYGVVRSLDSNVRRRLARQWFFVTCWVDEHRPVLIRTARAQAIEAYIKGRGEGFDEGRKSAVATLSKLRQVPTPIRRRAN